VLTELIVRDLGVVAEARLLFGAGLTVVTGETGAGKTMVVGALELLAGGKTSPALVRTGAPHASVEGRFLVGDEEVVLSRVVPADGRSRAYIDGRMAGAMALAERIEPLLEVYAQHAHQRLVSPGAQRAALDAFAGTDLGPVDAARGEIRRIDADLESIGGDEQARARELDLLRFQADEIDAARLTNPDEDAVLEADEARLAGAEDLREAAGRAHALLSDDDGAGDLVRQALAAVSRMPLLDEPAGRLADLAADLDDIAAGLRDQSESFEADPARLVEVQERRRLLADLVKKHGDDLAGVLDHRAEIAERICAVEQHEETAARLEADRAAALEALAEARAKVAAVRSGAAPRLADHVGRWFGHLALGGATLSVTVDGQGGDDVAFLLSANPGQDPVAVASAASGGELSRVMLSLNLVLGGDAPTLVFDEVDAGVGGAAGEAVGRALAELGDRHQVLVVTHLPQVAAFADHHLVVTKSSNGDQIRSEVAQVHGEERVAELARMLAGRSRSDTARTHADELLADAAARPRS